jgi:hypothetical protein
MKAIIRKALNATIIEQNFSAILPCSIPLVLCYLNPFEFKLTVSNSKKDKFIAQIKKSHVSIVQ